MPESAIPDTTLTVDPDLLHVLQFMQRSMSADKLVAVAELVPDMARLLWGHYRRAETEPQLRLLEQPPDTSQMRRVVSVDQ